MTKEYQIRFDVQKEFLEKMVNKGGWSIDYRQFMPNDKLNIIFVRDCPDTPPVATPAAVPVKRITATMQQIVVVEKPAERVLAHFPPVGRIHQAAEAEWNRRYIQALDEGIAMVNKASQSFTKHTGGSND